MLDGICSRCSLTLTVFWLLFVSVLLSSGLYSASSSSSSITAGTALLRADDGKDLEDLNIYAVEAITRWKAGINLACDTRTIDV